MHVLFFKQKTAYEMRISDWSSDVCSSDLPDPRDDLGGVDVARKLVILAREAGNTLELSDVQTESLVPDALRDIDGAAFLANAEALDAPTAERLAAARASGGVLRYVARFDTDGDRKSTRLNSSH